MTLDNKFLRTPHNLGSYALKLIDPKITTELSKRATSGNSVQTLMPFARLTSAIELNDEVAIRTKNRITTPGKYFSIGLHASQQHRADGNNTFLDNNGIFNYNNPFDSVYNIFSSTDADRGPIIGTIRQQSNGVVRSAYVRAKTDPSAAGQEFQLATDNLYASPPGIENITIDRKNNGQVNSAQVKISVPTLTQFEALAEIFFVPGVTMILEWGSISSTNVNDLTMLPWHDLSQIDNTILLNSGFGPNAFQIFEKYTYPSNGRYSFIVGKLASFDATLQSNGQFDINIRLVGPGEQNFAYTIYDTVSAILPDDNPSTALGGGSISQYFAANNDFDTLLSINPSNISGRDWSTHVIKPTRGVDTGDAPQKSSGTDSADGQAAVRETQQNIPAFLNELQQNGDPVFVSWKFFVNVILNDPIFGIKKLFNQAPLTTSELGQIRLINQLLDADDVLDPDEPFVGCHTYLRSTDPSVCVIYNAAAESAIRNGNTPWKAALGDEHLSRTAESNAAEFTKLGSFALGNNSDRGLLSKGVWLNAQAIRQSLMSGRTLHDGIANLLNRMNAAVNGYWELTLDFDEQEVTYESLLSGELISITNYLVIDRKYRGVLEKLKKAEIYKFNKFYNPATGVGSDELLEFNVALNTPPLLMTQLAFGRPTSDRNKTGVAMGGHDSSMQNLFEPTVSGGLSLIDIDIVRKNISAQNTTLTGRAAEAAAKQGANSLSQTPVISAQGTKTTELNSEQLIQNARESTFNKNKQQVDYIQKQIDEKEAKRKQLREVIGTRRTTATVPRSSDIASTALLDLDANIIEIVEPLVAVKGETALVAKLVSGVTVKRIGSRNWRNHNPGNIRKGSFANANGAIGSDADDGFAIFPNYETGRRAKEKLLFEGRNYKNLTISNAIARYAPASENDTVRYQRIVIQAVGGDFILSQMTRDQRQRMLDAMEKHEGFKVGSIEVVDSNAPPVVTGTATNAAEVEELANIEKEINNLKVQQNAIKNVIGPGKQLEIISNRYPYLRSVFTLIEFAPDLMGMMMSREPNLPPEEKDNFEINNNLKYSLNPLEANLKIVGISGIRIGELVRIGRLPKRLFENRGAWQILGITDTISPEEGWVSNIRCRFMPLPPVIVNQLKDI